MTAAMMIGGLPLNLRADDTGQKSPMTTAQQQLGDKLLGAISTGNAAEVEALLNRGANPEYRHQNSRNTPLMEVAEKGKTEIVKVLVNHGAKLDPQGTFHGNTPLILAALHGHLEIVKILVEHGANINVNSTTHGHGSLLSGEGIGPPDPIPLGSAAQGGHTDIIEYLISKGAKIDGADGSSYTPLMWAAETGGPETVKALLRHHANVNIKTAEGYTALNLAALHGRLEIVKLLVEGKADVNTNVIEPGHGSPRTSKKTEPDGSLPPRTAVVNGRTVTVSGQSHAALYYPTPLGSAALGGQTAVTEYLLSKGAKIDGRDRNSYTPLMWASGAASVEGVKVLLRHGADATLQAVDGKTARSLAAARNATAVLALLDGAKKE